MGKHLKAFVLMPFSDSFDDVYQFGIKGAAEKAGFACSRLDEQIFQGSMLQRIMQQILDCDLVIADMTGRNPNVFYEVGYAHAIGKTTILLAQSTEDIPFDLRDKQHIVYSGKLARLKESLFKQLQHYHELHSDKNLPARASVLEDFCNNDHFQKIQKVGNWHYDNETSKITGYGMHSYLLSESQYKSNFNIDAIISFDELSTHKMTGTNEFNSGIVMGFNGHGDEATYHNLLISGTEYFFEKIGGRGIRDVVRDFEHLSVHRPLKVVQNRPYYFRIKFGDYGCSAEVDGREEEVLSQILPRDFNGRVGIRAWRCRVTVHKFQIWSQT